MCLLPVPTITNVNLHETQIAFEKYFCSTKSTQLQDP